MRNLQGRSLLRRTQGTGLLGHPGELGPMADYLFDQGGMASFAVIEETAPTIRINPFLDISWSGSRTQWWAIRSRRWAGRTPVFVFAKATFWFTLTSGMWIGAWASASDTDTWYRFDNVTIGASDITISNNTPFPPGMIYVAIWPMYPFSRTQRLVKEWSANPLVGETVSSTNKIISLSPQTTADANGRSSLGLPYYAFKVANATANTKNNAILSSRAHAAEPPGGWSFEGALQWLLTSGAEQKFLLDWFNFNCYPCLYPENVINGHSRANWNDYSRDFNGLWNEPGVIHAQDVYKTAMAADTGGTVEVGLDFHAFGTAVSSLGDVTNSLDPMIVEFSNQVKVYDPVYQLLQEPVTGGVTVFWMNTLSARLALYAEHGFANTKTPADWKTYGANNMKALTRMLARGYFTNGPAVGCREFNGTSDRIDWASVYNPKGTPTTIAMWLYLDTNRASQYFLNIGEGNTTGFWLTTGGAAGVLQLGILGTGWMARVTNTSTITSGSWFHVVATYSGVFGPLASIRLYKNGVECTYNDPLGVIGSGTENEHTGSWSIGGRILDDARNMDGKAAQVGVWDRVLTPTEITNLAAGHAPDFAAPTNLRFYFKGNTSSLANSVAGGANGTADGTTQLTGAGNGPGIIYP